MSSTKADDYSSDAASIIKTIDSASNEARNSALSASKEVEEARRNARAASEVAKKFMALANSSSPFVNMNNHGYDFQNGGNSPHGTPQRITHFPTSPLSSLNGRSPDRSRNTRLGSPSSMHSPSSDRLARANADAVVSLTLELDRCKHHLEAEQVAHDETRSTLSQVKAQNAQLEAQIERLRSDSETQREKDGRRIDSLEHELLRAQMRVAAAEEDAQLALDLAKQNNDSRLEVEACLEQTMVQVEHLQREVQSKDAQLQTLSAHPRSSSPPLSMQQQRHGHNRSQESHFKSAMKSVRFADSPTAAPSVTSQATPGAIGSRGDVSLGRQLLQRALNAGSPASPASVNGAFPAHDDQMPMASVERSRRLQEKVSKGTLETDIMSPSSVASSVSATPPADINDDAQAATAATSALQSISNVLKASGKRLSLSGRWWSDKETASSKDARNIETLARHYCTSVEVLIDQKHKEIVELESLCALWEKGSATE
ncbi:hypothetical protein MPSEU_000491000 [Mayamaea pseudoterrestris]|nr:hypothetical protein MPSEU_000491000 [Mayamaea pseudoterrestris]